MTEQPPATGWIALSGLLAAGSLAAWWLPAAALDWQPARFAQEPWRCWTAAFVHWSPLHLLGNLAGTALVALFGAVARLPARVAWAWAAAWPLTHLALLARPELAHYGGLSGVLHAGVAVAATGLAVESRGARRGIALAVLAGLAAKVVIEEPWGPALREGSGWNIAVAPLAHAAGAGFGALAALIAQLAQAAQSLARARR